MKPEKHAGLVKRMAFQCYRRLPNNSKYTVEDLEQEGWVIFCKLRKVRYRPDGASFSTLLRTSIVRRFSSIIRDEYRDKRSKGVYMAPDVLDAISASQEPTPLEEVLVKQTIEELTKISPEFADLFIHGVPPELLRMIRNRNRLLAKKRGWSAKNMRLIFRPEDMEHFFGIDLKKILDHLQTSGV